MMSATPSTTSTGSTSSGVPSWGTPWRRFALALLAFLAGGFLGFLVGQPLGYWLTKLFDRDPAEVKDMLIWCFIATPIVMSALAAWLALVLMRARRIARTVALTWLILVTTGAVAMMAAS